MLNMCAAGKDVTSKNLESNLPRVPGNLRFHWLRVGGVTTHTLGQSDALVETDAVCSIPRPLGEAVQTNEVYRPDACNVIVGCEWERQSYRLIHERPVQFAQLGYIYLFF